MANEIILTNDTFESEVMQSDIPVLVDFWADWCGPCKMLSPVIGQLADDYAGKAKVCKVNVDEQSELAAKFKIMTIPTVIIFKDGEEKEKSVGVRPKADFSKMLDNLL